MFQKKDLPSVLFLALLIFIIVLTLCQILVVHRHDQRGYHLSKNQQLAQRKKMYHEMIGNYNFKKYKNIAKIEVFRRRIKSVIIMLSEQNNGMNIANDNGDVSAVIPTVREDDSMTLCDRVPPKLVGEISVQTCDTACRLESRLAVESGGYWKPATCISRHRVLIVIPFRDRWRHLTILLHNLVGMLQRQQLEFRILVAEQFGNATFNKGRLMNAAFLEAKKRFRFHCVIFHDVDLVPENDRNLYSCPWQPTHLSVAVDEMHYRLKYELLVGGVLAITSEHFQLVNGYSNEYWGWGAEDDDMAYRILLSGLRIMRPSAVVARYRMLRHEKREPSAWSSRTRLLKSVNKRFQMDGLINVPYRLVFSKDKPLFMHMMVDVGLPKEHDS
ncbi:beta-1,4-N-acetylgalactosaminyltransferase bre-4-like [Pecten maximus]|uniref:beta-1,4-N-acetylgalactosaminyltransferase bre-4-like n=1 Tax=Pecten maximus TaxID=6579 RepID=UPI001458FCDB|nr:beta-1,4-N-acetylgalactosaminyltransferase bre-4-like [Pecten maximus]